MFYYAVGDIHGCYAQLKKALEYLRGVLTEEDYVVFLGDYTDRGPDTKDCIKQVIAFKKKHKNTICLRGNHEDMMLGSFEYDAKGFVCRLGGYQLDLWCMNGGIQTLKSYTEENIYETFPYKFPKEHLKFLQETLKDFETENLYFVHAGVLPDNSNWREYGRDARLWIRWPFLESNQDFGKLVVFGHTPQYDTGLPLVQKNKVGLDTGCVFLDKTPKGGKLSIGRFEDRKEPLFKLIQITTELEVIEDESYLNEE